MRYRFFCRRCGTQVVYRDRVRGYVHVDHRVCNGSQVADRVGSYLADADGPTPAAEPEPVVAVTPSVKDAVASFWLKMAWG